MEKQIKRSQEITIIGPDKKWFQLDLDEIWKYRELLYFFAWRDVKVRYKQTLIGIVWAVLQPFLTMIVFSIFFGKFAKVPSDGVPYPIFVYVGLLPWNLFSQGLTRAAESVLAHSNLIKKIYFPRIITPVAASLLSLVDFIVAAVILFAMMMFYQTYPSTLAIVLFPLLVLLTFLCSVGFGLWLCAINVIYRDVKFTLPFIIQLGMFVTPVIYPVSIVSNKFSWLLYLNPMAGVIETFRAVLLGHKDIPVMGLTMSVVIILSAFISGIFFFRKMESKFADVL